MSLIQEHPQEDTLPAETKQSCWISSLKASNFRSYESLRLSFVQKPVVITGPNGAGKTNILEAISLLTPGRGFRKSKLGILKNFQHPETPWNIHAGIQLPEGEITISTGLDMASEKERRIVKINGAPQAQTALNEWIRIIWQTPQSDCLFLEGMGVRRRFLDTLITQVTPSHSKHLYRYDYSLRERSKLLKEGASDQNWLKVLEETLAQETVAIAAARADFLERLNQHGLNNVTNFPKFHMEINGLAEKWLDEMPALSVEEKIQAQLHTNRGEDAMVGGSKIGAHQSEIRVINLDYNHPAEVCSTGEQKALLLSLMLANCRLQSTVCGMAPILLLDEVVAHLDEGRRQSLFEEILALNVQAWLTGTDPEVFSFLQDKAQFLTVNNATVKEG